MIDGDMVSNGPQTTIEDLASRVLIRTSCRRLQCYSPDSNVEAKANCTASTYYIRCVQVHGMSPQCPSSPPAASELRRWSRWPDSGQRENPTERTRALRNDYRKPKAAALET